ncbi:MAG: hypothetical protein JEZ02_12590 [Desulfatibacillum sp.]|nr:hypothetical protein [Desulfatibacillum sp.]
MGALYDTMLDITIRDQVVSDYARLISNQVASKSGPTGMMLKAGYKGIKGVKPGYINEMVEVLLPSFMEVLDAHHMEYSGCNSQTPFDAWISGCSQTVADQLLCITDKVIHHADKKVVIKIYKGVRKIAQKHVSMAIPEMAAVTMKYMD